MENPLSHTWTDVTEDLAGGHEGGAMKMRNTCDTCDTYDVVDAAREEERCGSVRVRVRRRKDQRQILVDVTYQVRVSAERSRQCLVLMSQ